MVSDKRKRSTGPIFPHDSLKKCLKIAESIERNNAGKPYDRLSLAQSLNQKPSGWFRQLITSSSRYGITEGSYAALKIALTSLGSQIVAPTSDRQVTEGIIEALLKPDLFAKILRFYDTKIIPREELFKNTLRKEFSVDPKDVDVCYKVLMTNIKDYNLTQRFQDTERLRLENLGEVPRQEGENTPQENPDQDQEEGPDLDMTNELETGTKTARPKVFISHSKNKKIVEQIKTILDFGQFDYVIAEERETTAIPIAEKVFGLMKECNCAIINLSVDEQEEKDGNYLLNFNVLVEIGAAFLQYNKKVILLVDKRLSANLPSNLDGLYRSEYQGNELSFDTAMKLQAALTGFREKK